MTISSASNKKGDLMLPFKDRKGEVDLCLKNGCLRHSCSKHPGRTAIGADVLEVAHVAESAVAGQVVPTGRRRPGRARGILHDIFHRVPAVWEA